MLKVKPPPRPPPPPPPPFRHIWPRLGFLIGDEQAPIRFQMNQRVGKIPKAQNQVKTVHLQPLHAAAGLFGSCSWGFLLHAAAQDLDLELDIDP